MQQIYYKIVCIYKDILLCYYIIISYQKIWNMIIYKENNINICKSIDSKCSRCYVNGHQHWLSGLVKFSKGGIK